MNSRELQYDFSGLPDVEVEAKPIPKDEPISTVVSDGVQTWITLGILGLVAICMGVMIAIGVGI